jgi:hypothetical protein
MLRAFPFQTFDEIAGLGLEVTIYCPNCYRTVGPIDLADERLRGRRFNDGPFTSSAMRQVGYAHTPRSCGCTGMLSIRPPSRDFIPPDRAVPWCSIACPRCVPPWEVNQAARHLPPWKNIWTEPGVRLACPACRSPVTTTWHGSPGIPRTDGFRRDVTPPSPPAAA